MPSTTATSPDTLVTLKINFNGNSRRLKLPLRDLGAATLEDKLREFLAIPRDTEALIERYSDSAAAFVVLDPSNVSVYKQLYRAAKAKQRLKIRITTKAETPEAAAEPAAETDVAAEQKPTAVEAEPQPKAEPEPTPVVKSEPETVAEEKAAEATSAVEMEQPAWPHSKFEDRLADVARLTERLREVQLVAERHAQMNMQNNWSDSPVPDQKAPESVQPAAEAPAAPVPTVDVDQSRWFQNCVVPLAARPQFAICCNSCDKTIPNEHFHCSICDEGDFDLCQDCVDRGVTCHVADHWLIKRTVEGGCIKYSNTERLAPKRRSEETATKPVVDVAAPVAAPVPPPVPAPMLPYTQLADIPARGLAHPAYRPGAFNVRTCNCCVQELPERRFVHCTTCEDYDLCMTCFAKDKHGHHPGHGFTAVSPSANLESHVAIRLAPGRNQSHNAICDGCDSYIRGVRHKCLDCPDWDYCSSCYVNASFVHPGHRFVPVYEPLVDRFYGSSTKPVHHGICCDGPLCANPRSGGGYIRGDRYKCAVCHDTDFCAACEASPANMHNRTHPLIKFKTPVRHVSVTTSGEHEDGRLLPRMGDRMRVPPAPSAPSTASSRSTETVVQEHTATPVQTVVDVEPVAEAKAQLEAEAKVEEQQEPQRAPEAAKEEPAPTAEPAPEPKQEPAEPAEKLAEKPAAAQASDLVAIYVSDTVTDGTVLAPNVVFEQTWVLRNCGNVAWPAGCSVKFVGGDYMGHVDPNHPAGIHELVSASESTVCYAPLAPGQEFAFTVLLRTPSREGRAISYWRLTTKDGIKFGHRLWCDINVQAPPKPAVSAVVEAPKAVEVPPPVQSQMIFPKLEKESPEASTVAAPPAEAEPAATMAELDDFEECGDEEWDEESDEGFMTDEEYDILDASDEEYLHEQSKKLLKK